MKVSDYITEAMKLDEEISPEIVNQAVEFVKGFRHTNIDTLNKKIIVPLDKGLTEEDIMEPNMLGDWLVKQGFDVSFHVGDFDYVTQDTWINRRGWTSTSGHPAKLRNRTIMTITWE